MASDADLDARLAAAGVPSDTTPVDAWRRLRAVEGPRCTVIDLYELVARERGVTASDLPLTERIPLARSVLPDVWPAFATTAGSERHDDPIRVVEYDARWPADFGRWRRVVDDCLGATALRIEHVGSTSVPGLAAKPIIDIQISVADPAAETRFVPHLERAGLQLRSRDDLHRYFRPFPGQPRAVHVHVCAANSVWEREHLLFRDYLRTHSQARADYVAAKRQAAAVWADDGIAYTDAKSTATLAILEQAEQWQRIGAVK